MKLSKTKRSVFSNRACEHVRFHTTWVKYFQLILYKQSHGRRRAAPREKRQGIHTRHKVAIKDDERTLHGAGPTYVALVLKLR